MSSCQRPATRTRYCVAEGVCSKGDVVRCAWSGGHDYYGGSGNINSGRLVWEFLQRWSRPCHAGGGAIDADGGCAAVLMGHDNAVCEPL